MLNVTLFIDESGTLSDLKDQIVVVAAVGTNFPKMVNKISKSSTGKLAKGEKATPEIKFYRSGERTKRLFLAELAKEDVEIFTLTVDKGGQKISDTPENFAVLCWFLIEDCIIFYGNQIKEIVFDRHFHQLADRALFNEKLTALLDKKITLTHVDSQQNPAVNTADMVAGSLLWARTGKENKFYRMIKNKIISEKVINWKEIKGRFLQKIPSNRRKRPSRRE